MESNSALRSIRVKSHRTVKITFTLEEASHFNFNITNFNLVMRYVGGD